MLKKIPPKMGKLHGDGGEMTDSQIIVEEFFHKRLFYCFHVSNVRFAEGRIHLVSGFEWQAIWRKTWFNTEFLYD